jgi:Mrp family chromosome partitioning ATPase
MGRMLETLKLGEGRRAPVAISKPEAAPVQDCVTDWEIAEEVPYIEVGGPNKKVELSPGLMKHPPQVAPRPPHLPAEPALAPAAVKPMAAYVTPARPMAVAYEPWPSPMPAPVGVSAEIIAYHQPEHATSKEYAALLQTLRAGLKTDSAGVLLLAGLKPKVGTSTVLLNLAVLAAQAQKLRVMLIDGNQPGAQATGQAARESPSLALRAGIAQRLGHSPSAGFMDVIDGAVALEQAIVRTGIGSLHLLPTGASTKTHRPLSAEAMAWLIAWLRERYDLILIDGPSAEDAAALAVHLPYADGVYLVLPRGATATGHEGAAQTLRRMGGRLGGLIHTHFDV